ncbi:MAG: hypothetical protein ACLGG1_08430 [Gammaproteobacteria bacterium]
MADYLAHFPEPFLEDMVQGRCLPFVGAGFSLNAKMRAGQKMLDPLMNVMRRRRWEIRPALSPN